VYFKLADISKSFAGQPVLDSISFAMEQGDFVCLLGPSGCGKTTLLRIIAGLLPADTGSLLLGDKELAHVPARQRGFGIVFQSYSLFPHMSVAENIAYGMSIRGASAGERTERVKALLQLVQLPDAGAKYPAQLSGGQQQRVALARALAVHPALLLLDEPLSALDARVREQMRNEIQQLQRQLRIPTIMVTHDQEEALTLADTIICMNRGRIEQCGSPRELYLQPRTRFVAQFIGASNLLSTAWIGRHAPAMLLDRPIATDDAYDACIRPEDIQLSPDATGAAQITSVQFLGSQIRLAMDWHGQSCLVDQHRQSTLAVGDRVTPSITPGRCIWVSTCA
jgi:iron(III) transport system ATP-binding protein